MRHEISLTYRKLRTAAFTYLMLPMLIFLATFLKTVFAAPSALVLLLIWGVSCFRRRDDGSDARPVTLPLGALMLAVAVALIWALLGGQGGFLYQTSDWNERNALFRDLIVSRWPVYYPETDTVLTYYVGHWMPAAVLGKAAYLLSGSLAAGWTVGNLALWLWTALGALLTFLMVFRLVGANDAHRRGIALVGLIFFSGLDLFGTFMAKWHPSDYLRIMHLEWWCPTYQFSAVTTCLFWVFNQAVPAWVGTACTLNENLGGVRTRNYGFILISMLICGPLPAVGLVCYMLYSIVHKGVRSLRERFLGAFLKETFSLENLGMAVLIFPIVGTFLTSNAALGGTSVAAKAVPMQLNKPAFIAVYILGMAVLMFFNLRKKRIPLPVYDRLSHRARARLYAAMFALAAIGAVVVFMRFNVDYVGFVVMEFGLYMLILFPFLLGESDFYITALLLGITPLIRIGLGSDFCMRASIPAILTLVTLCLRFLIDPDGAYGARPYYKLCRRALIVLLVIAACTPCMEIWRTLSRSSSHPSADRIQTLNQYYCTDSIYGNFVSDSYEGSLFFSKLSRLEASRKFTKPDAVSPALWQGEGANRGVR